MNNIKKITALIGLATLGISTTHAGVYVGADAGYAKVHTGNVHYAQKTNNTSSSASGVINSSNKNRDLESIKIGYAVNNTLRTEVALTRYGNINNSYVITNTVATVDRVDVNRPLKSRALMVNAYYDFDTTSQLQPYVMSGIGIGMHKTGFEVSVSKAGGTAKVDDNNLKRNFAYQVGVGASYKITDQLYADTGVKYAYLGKSSTEGLKISQNAKISSVNATVGIRHSF